MKRKLKPEESRSGYINDFSFNPDWEKHKAICGYEHCIELMPLEHKNTSCPIFGHNCPGGVAMVKECKSQIEDIPEERIYQGDINAT
ncbi:hypothetical protein LCGC14_2676210 [marine sediment metagenome]|uniref:Uncharacterized protein n=1 Tax=marine sediment metagenome TaxID=412755 RepID=A0A0F9BXM3_9ZZZZ